MFEHRSVDGTGMHLVGQDGSWGDLLLVALKILVACAVLAVWPLLVRVTENRRMRAATARLATELFPDDGDLIRATARVARPLLRPHRVPADPLAQVRHIVVRPAGDGRPGAAFWGPGPILRVPAQDRSKQHVDVAMNLGPSMRLVVSCIGPLGSERIGGPLLPAPLRATFAQDHPLLIPVEGPRQRVLTRAGEAWRTTNSRFGDAVLTDTHIDHDGWGFIIGVVWVPEVADGLAACDAVLSTWEWLPAHPAR